jgi:serine phosphatase RsbU (regulator of sigma subunit)/ligand-binding sensor domain-containing protein
MRLLLLTIFSGCGLVSFSQDFYPPVVNYSTQQYGKDRNPEIWCAVQDKRGVVYFGTGNGVLEYDGMQWNFIEVQQGAYVRAIAVDSSGVVYCGGSGEFGYLRVNSKGEMSYVSLVNKLDEFDRFFFDVFEIYASADAVFFQARDLLFRYDLKTKKIQSVYPDVSYHLSFMENNRFYVRSREIGVQRYDDTTLVTLPGTDVFKEYGLFGVYETSDDSLLFVTQEIGLWKWKNGAMRQLPEVNEVSLNSLGIFGSQRLSDGSIALTTLTSGLIIIDEQGRITKWISQGKGLRSNDVKNIYEDRDHNLWLALGNGISKVNYYSPLSYFNEKAGIDGNVESIIRYKNRLYAGTSFGLFVQDTLLERESEFYNVQLVKNSVWDFCIVDNELYVATATGIYKTSGDDKFTQLNGRNANVIFFLPAENWFVLAGLEGIYVYTKSFGLVWNSVDVSDRFLGAELDPTDPNTLWLGSSKTGVYRLKWSGTDFTLDTYTVNDGLIDDNLGAPILLEGKVVFGSSQGLLKFIHEDEMIKGYPDSLKNDPNYYRGMFEQQTFFDSGFDAQVLLIKQAKDRTWYSADHKIGYYDHASKQFVNRPFSGINYGRVNEFYLEEDGVFWIGCSDGLIRFQTNELKKYDLPFYAAIRQFAINRDSVLFNGAFADDNGNVSLSQNPSMKFEIAYDFNDVYFRFAAPFFEDDHLQEYSYILEGHDEDWSAWGPLNEATFTNLGEGDYVFRVKARNIYGHISEEAVFGFSVLPPWYRTFWAYAGYVLAFILVLFAGVKISSARLKAKNVWLEGVVEERTKEITLKNVELEHQKKEISDSINYAKRIQEAILPLEDEMRKWIPKSFVLFRPKDVVSGDFYWFQEKDGKLIIVCADCTGHGVPGAFMSMIGSDRLNNIVNELRIVNPGRILSELNKSIKKSLKQDGERKSSRDGMDAAICTIDLANRTMLYAGANRPLWVFRNGVIEEVKANKVAVAGFTADSQVFDEHEIALEEGLKFYMTSDGYADQFGGDKGKKYMVKNMKEFILKHCSMAYQVQRDKLEQELVDWMGSHEQIDDVCVIGFEA